MTTAINHAEFNGLRITPSVYTTPGEVDLFAELVGKAIKGAMTT
jgi:hypothetical protein